jgi:hypothetical protein
MLSIFSKQSTSSSSVSGAMTIPPFTVSSQLRFQMSAQKSTLVISKQYDAQDAQVSMKRRYQRINRYMYNRYIAIYNKFTVSINSRLLPSGFCIGAKYSKSIIS